MSTSRPLHLAVALADAGWHPGAWREPDAGAKDLFTARHWLEQVREAELGMLDFVTIEDSFRLQATAAVGPDGRTDRVRGRLDAVLIAARVAPHTRAIGIVPVASTTLTEPLAVSSAIATLDYVSHGRAGWQAMVSLDQRDGGYVGPRAIAPPREAFEEAIDHVEVVRRLWDSWEDGAEIRDVAANRFVDRRLLHHVDFESRFFDVRGPSITPRPPQGQPIVATFADTDAARGFAVRSADVVFVAAHDEHELAAARQALDVELRGAGRDPASLLVLMDVLVFLDGESGAAAQHRARLDAFDGSTLVSDTHVFTGTPARLAERLAAWSELGVDGFRLRSGAVPHDLRAIARDLVPALRALGVRPPRRGADTLRGVLGLERPANRYAAA